MGQRRGISTQQEPLALENIMNGLILHCGANAATIDAIHAVPTPDATPSWQPIPHGDLYSRELLRQQLEAEEFAESD